MIKKLLCVIALIVGASSYVLAQSSGALKGKVTDAAKKEALPFANVVVELGGKMIGGVQTDFDGNYTIKPIPAGEYDVKVSLVGYQTVIMSKVLISPDKITFLDFPMESSTKKLEEVVIKDYKVPLISKDQTSAGQTVTSEEIKKMATRSAEGIATTVGGVFSSDGERGSVRGSRSDATVTYIDGMKVIGGSSLPNSAIDQVSVLTGGLPAQYGDATGGIINITTKGPSRKFAGGLEYLTSEPFDNHGYNLLGFNFQGPIIKSKDKTSSLFGYFLSGELSSQRDPIYRRKPLYTVKPEILAELEKNPLRPTGLESGGTFRNAEFIGTKDLVEVKKVDNVGNYGINLSGKLDVKTTDNTNLTFGGTFSYDAGKNFDWSSLLFNNKNNNEYFGTTWRLYGRFTQRFQQSKDSKSLVKNIYYSIQADYQQSYSTTQDPTFKDNLFKYGYIGQFTTYKAKYYTYGYDKVANMKGWLLTNFYDTLYTFKPAQDNIEAANYTSQYYNLHGDNHDYYRNSIQIQNGGALLNGNQPTSSYGIWANTGTKQNVYSHAEANQYSFSANGSADIKNHAINFGFQFEQSIDRSYSYAPVGLWTLMRRLANKHIEQLDLDNPLVVYDANGTYMDTINYNRKFSASEQSFFDKNLRKKLGKDVNGTEWIDVDNLSPDVFNINMFSPDELFNDGKSLVGYAGYDYTGKKITKQPSIDDFFSTKDEYGNYKRAIGAYEPIYVAGYISDKFAFNDLIFNLGLRVDRFDANQKVLKDPYLLYEAKTVGEVTNLAGETVKHPSNIGKNYVVYVNQLTNPTAILGYRNGSVWYNAQGFEVTDPTVIESSNGIAPYLVNPENTTISSKVFKDYDPQTSFMPRISFSFPISDEALFFAHYDVMTRRPTSGAGLSLTDYLFIQSRNSVISNPDLKPEKTIEYELGFQQKLTNTSSLKLSTYYREMRNMAQVIRISDAYPVSYMTYGNIDFGTVKGFMVSYDKRRTKNVWMKANYFMQFADGTGSSAVSAASLIIAGQPNLRATNPLSYDRRHNIQLVFDIRFDGGKDYNGPVWTRKIKGTDKTKSILWLENTGLNLTFIGGSGTPYSKQSNIISAILGGGTPILQGSINGARLPWSFKMDAKLDRDFILHWGGKKEGSKEKIAFLNVYITMSNVLNTKNVKEVYRATGSPSDDGYLAAAEYQSQIRSQTSELMFRQQYELMIDSPFNYSTPRITRIGMILNF
jgi:outer membrane receptor protein involved in Fe transport